MYDKIIVILGIIVSLIIITVILGKLKITEHFDTENKGKNESTSEDDLNLVKNGSFKDGNGIGTHLGTSSNNDIIAYPNPGSSKYVLRQSSNSNLADSNETQYKFSADVKPQLSYKLSCWVYNTNPFHKKSKDGKDSKLYTIYFHMKKDNSIRYITPDTTTSYKTDAKHKWSKREVIFDVPTDSNGKIDIVLSHSLKGNSKQYIADVNLQIYNNNIPNFKYNNSLSFYTNTQYDKSFSKPNGKVWKDLSNQGRNFILQNKIKNYSDNLIYLKNNLIIGPDCDKLGLDMNDFTLVWTFEGLSKHISGSFLKLFSSADSGSVINIYLEPDNNDNNTINLSYLNDHYKWVIGLATYKMHCILTHKDNIFTLTINGNPLKPIKSQISHKPQTTLIPITTSTKTPNLTTTTTTQEPPTTKKQENTTSSTTPHKIENQSDTHSNSTTTSTPQIIKHQPKSNNGINKSLGKQYTKYSQNDKVKPSSNIPLFNPNIHLDLQDLNNKNNVQSGTVQSGTAQSGTAQSGTTQSGTKSNIELVKPVEEVEIVRPVEEVEIVRPVDRVEIVRPVDRVEIVRPVDRVEPATTKPPKQENYANYVIEHYTDNTKNYFINKPSILNSDKTLDVNIYSIMGFTHKLKPSQQKDLSSYLQCNSCHDIKSKSKSKSKIHTITEQDIMHVKDDVQNKMEIKELHDREKCKKILKHEESTNENNSNHPNHKLDKKKVLDTLINDINKKKYNPCIKVEYRIENGKIIKKRMELPNCKNCTNSQCSTPILQPADVYDKCNEEGTSNNSLPTNINHPEHNNPETCISRDTKTTPAHSQCIQHTPKHTPIYKPTKSHSKCTATVSTQHPNCIKPTTNPLKCILPKLTEKKSGLCNLPFNIK